MTLLKFTNGPCVGRLTEEKKKEKEKETKCSLHQEKESVRAHKHKEGRKCMYNTVETKSKRTEKRLEFF